MALKRRRPNVEKVNVVPFLGLDLGERILIRSHAVANDYLGVVLLPPFLDIGVVEPLVKGGDHVAVMKDFKLLPARTDHRRNNDICPESGR